MVTGFYAASLAQRQKGEAAKTYCLGIYEANRKGAGKDTDAGFPEFLHGKRLTPGGTDRMAWSAAAGVISEHYIAGARLFGYED